MTSIKNIVDKFCDGPAQMAMSSEAIQDCRDCTTLEDLIYTVSHHFELASSASAALFILEHLDYEID